MSRRDSDLLIEDILESINKIFKYTSGLDFESFVNDDKTTDAVIRNFEIIGEAANRLHPDFKVKNSSIDWDRLRGFRNRIVHEYFGIDLEIVWNIIVKDLKVLEDEIKNIPLQ